MSVLLINRNESRVEFIEQARNLVLHTWQHSIKFPKNTMFKFQMKLFELSNNVLENVVSGNSIMSNNELRREYFQKSLANLNSFENLLSIIQSGYLQYISDFGWNEWGRLITLERKLILGQLKKL